MDDEKKEGAGDVIDQYRKQKLIEGLKDFMRDVREGVGGRGEPVKTVPMRPEWADAWAELQRTSAAHGDIERRHSVARDYFWAIVHKGLDDFREMRIDPKTGEIEIFEEAEDG